MLLRFSRAVSLVASSLPIAIKRFHFEYCNLRANPSIPAKLSTFVPFCPPLGVILSTFVLPSSFLPNSPSPSYDAPSSIASGFYPDIGSRSRPILHRLPSLLSFVRPPSSSLLLSLTLAAVSASTASLSRLCMPIPAYHCLKWPILANRFAYIKKKLYLCTRNYKLWQISKFS